MKKEKIIYDYYKPLEGIWDDKEQTYRYIDLARCNLSVRDSRKVTKEQAERLLEKNKHQRMTQWEYHRNKITGETTRTSFYETHKLRYRLEKVHEERELVFEEESLPTIENKPNKDVEDYINI